MIHTVQVDEWTVSCDVLDGGRLTGLNWRGIGLLTSRPDGFRPPDGDWGRYETRPVFGYDDCFPSVDSCSIPDPVGEVPDHGELCWLPADVESLEHGFRTTWNCRIWPGVFIRELVFSRDTLVWTFRVKNTSDRTLRFLHVMHALMPLDGLEGLRLPDAKHVHDEFGDVGIDADDGPPARRLLDTPEGVARMWLLRGIAGGWARMVWRSGLCLEIRFPEVRFGTLGVWWNRRGYPGGGATARHEFAIEPIPGAYSSLARCMREGGGLAVEARSEATWSIEWTVGANTNAARS